MCSGYCFLVFGVGMSWVMMYVGVSCLLVFAIKKE